MKVSTRKINLFLSLTQEISLTYKARCNLKAQKEIIFPFTGDSCVIELAKRQYPKLQFMKNVGLRKSCIATRRTTLKRK